MSAEPDRTDDNSLGLSAEDMDRIAAFAATPKYARKPEMLVPDGTDGTAEAGE